jgi:hypothetical protein
MVGCQPVFFTNFELSPSRIGTSLGRRRAGSSRTSILVLVSPEQWSSSCLDRPCLAGADVVDLARLAVLERQPVGRTMSRTSVKSRCRLEVADAAAPAAWLPFLDVGDLLGEVAGHEHRPRRGPSWLNPRVRTLSTLNDIQYW